MIDSQELINDIEAMKKVLEIIHDHGPADDMTAYICIDILNIIKEKILYLTTKSMPTTEIPEST